MFPEGFTFWPDPTDTPLSQCSDYKADMTRFFGDSKVDKAMCVTLHTEAIPMNGKLNINGFFDCTITNNGK